MSLRQCSPRRKLLCSSLPAWQPRQVSEIFFEDLFLNEMIFAGSPSSRWALPGPWHDSQPVTFSFQLLRLPSFACDVGVKFLNWSSWQSLQASLPTYSSSLAVVLVEN